MMNESPDWFRTTDVCTVYYTFIPLGKTNKHTRAHTTNGNSVNNDLTTVWIILLKWFSIIKVETLRVLGHPKCVQKIFFWSKFLPKCDIVYYLLCIHVISDRIKCAWYCNGCSSETRNVWLPDTTSNKNK